MCAVEKLVSCTQLLAVCLVGCRGAAGLPASFSLTLGEDQPDAGTEELARSILEFCDLGQTEPLSLLTCEVGAMGHPSVR